MKVILLEDVANLGQVGDVVKVNDGYARNMLFPRKMAAEANKKNMKNLEHKKAKLEKERAEALDKAKEEAEKIEALSITIKSKAGEGGKLFGSITSKDIADTLNSQHGVFIDKRKIQLDSPIKEAGETEVEIKLYPEVTPKLKVYVEV